MIEFMPHLPHTSLWAAFLAGLLSFVSPCVLPLVPSYLMYVTGLSLDQLANPSDHSRLRTTIAVNALLFIAGFSLLFVAFGATASFIGQMFTEYQDVVRKVGAVMIVLFGLYVMGMLKLPFLMQERRVHLSHRPLGLAGSFVIGATFAAGWTPCVGPILGTMLLYAGTSETLMDGVTLLGFYSMGLGLPLFATALSLNRFLTAMRRHRASLAVVSRFSGAFLVAIGVVLYTDRLALFTALFERYGIGSYLGLDGG
jgi:cytochrome c-type biogenesis protein